MIISLKVVINLWRCLLLWQYSGTLIEISLSLNFLLVILVLRIVSIWHNTLVHNLPSPDRICSIRIIIIDVPSYYKSFIRLTTNATSNLRWRLYSMSHRHINCLTIVILVKNVIYFIKWLESLVSRNSNASSHFLHIDII